VERVLVVDDEDAIRRTVAEMLEGDGYIADGAADGGEALAKLRGERPDAIVLDLIMPVMDGCAFVERCRQEPAGARVPIIVMSAARALPATTTRLHALGVQACLASHLTCRPCWPLSSTSCRQPRSALAGGASSVAYARA
jgi:CheY-like chemotaxis protein